MITEQETGQILTSINNKQVYFPPKELKNFQRKTKKKFIRKAHIIYTILMQVVVKPAVLTLVNVVGRPQSCRFLAQDSCRCSSNSSSTSPLRRSSCCTAAATAAGGHQTSSPDQDFCCCEISITGL